MAGEEARGLFVVVSVLFEHSAPGQTGANK